MNAKGWDVNFRLDMTCELGYKGSLLGSIPATGKLYAPNLEFIPSSDVPPITAPSTELSTFIDVPLSLDLWHARIGHISHDAVMHLNHVTKGITIQSTSPLSHCKSCILAKHPHLPFQTSETECAAAFLDLIHSDVCDLIPTITPHGKQYFIIFLNDHTYALDLQLLALKDQALKAWQLLCARWENLSGRCVKVFRSDNGGEFINEVFTANLEETGIQRQCSAPYTHQQNGKAEHVMRTIKGRMYAMLDFACLPPSLWGEAALTACYLFNWTESCALPTGKTPYEMLHGTQPTLSHLHVFSDCCFAHIPTELQQKLGPHSCEAIFMGYPPGVQAWRCRYSVTGAFFNSRDVIFDESLSNRPFPYSDDDDDDAPAQPKCAMPNTTPAPAPIEPPHAVTICHSSHIPVPTEKGQHLKDCLVSDKACLAQQCELHTACINGVPPLAGAETVDAPIITAPMHMPESAAPPSVDPDMIVPDDTEVGFSQIIANLIVMEVAGLSIWSNTHHNPLAPGYDLKLPPAIYDEAM
jgi:hypothetical protein